MNNILKTKNIWKTYRSGSESLHVLKGIDVTFTSGEMVALVGPSGSGKSSLLHILGLLDQPTQGHVSIDGHDVKLLPDAVRTRLRRDTVGFIYQFHYLQGEFTALENVMIPLWIKGDKKNAESDALKILEKVGLSHRTHHFPSQLSGGEKQRVAIARALVAKPKLLLADEPTGNLDTETSNKVFSLLCSLVKETQITAVIATHNDVLAQRMDRILTLQNGVFEPKSHLIGN